MNNENSFIYQCTFNEMSGFHFFKNPDFSYRLANKAIFRVAGLQNNTTLEGMRDDEMPWAIYAEHIRKMDELVLLRHEFLVYIEPVKLIDGNDYILLTRKKPLVDEEGKCLGIIGHASILANPLIIKKTTLLRREDIEQFGIYPSHYDIKKAFYPLTSAESICLFYYIRGKTSKEIAQRLDLSKRTIEKHLENIKVKLNCKNRSNLIEYAFLHNYFHIIPEIFIA